MSLQSGDTRYLWQLFKAIEEFRKPSHYENILTDDQHVPVCGHA